MDGGSAKLESLAYSYRKTLGTSTAGRSWKAIVLYLKDKTRKIKIFTPEFNIALLMTAAFVAGTYGGLAPFGWIQSLNDHLKTSAAAEYGEPPYGHAELSSLRTFVQKTGLDLANSMALLHQAGYPVEDGASTLQSIAARYGMSSQQLYDVIKPAAQRSVGSPSRPGLLPESPLPGTGNLTLAEFCARFSLNSTLILSGLSGKGITASTAMATFFRGTVPQGGTASEAS